MNKLLALIRGAALATGFLACTNVRANTITIDYIGNVGGLYTYDATATNAELVSGDYFEITDFDGLTGFTLGTVPVGFSFGVAPGGVGIGVGPIQALNGSTDSPLIHNPRFTWLGASGTEFLGPVTWRFTLTSSILTSVQESYSSVDHVYLAGTGNGGGSGIGGALTVAGRTPNVPEGGSALAMLGIGLIGIVTLRHKLKK